MVLLQDKLIPQAENRETSTQNMPQNHVARQVESYCISYLAAFTGPEH